MNDAQLIASLQARDEAAIDAAMRRYGRLVWSVVWAALGSRAVREDVEECTADVFVHLWEHPESFDPRRGGLRTWLALVARSRALDRYRQLARRGELSLEEALLAESGDPADRLAARERQEELRSALETLEETDRDILVRRYCEGQKPRDIALALGLAVKQVDNRLYRTKRRLRAVLTK